MKTSESGIEFIAQHEGCVLRAYDDLNPGRVLSPGDTIAGTLTIGYGHTGSDVTIGMTITDQQAKDLLAQDLKHSENAVNALGLDLSQNEFDALVSWVFNTGAGNLKNRNLINAIRRMKEAEAGVEAVWNRHYVISKGVRLAGLVRRRKEESDLFFSH